MLRVLAIAWAAIALAAPDAVAQDAKRLEHMVIQDCGSCHGLTLKGGLGRPITPQALADADPEAIAGIILDGVPGTAMPPWRPLITEDEALWMANYLKKRKAQMIQSRTILAVAAMWALALAVPASAGDPCCATGDLGLVVERASGSLVVVDRSEHAAVGRIEGLGDLSHASITYSPDERYAYVFGRDGGLTKVDILTRNIVKRVVQAGNSIGGAISDDGKLVAVSNYEPGGVRVFDAETLGHGGRHSRRRQDHRLGRCAGTPFHLEPVGHRRDLDRGFLGREDVADQAR